VRGVLRLLLVAIATLLGVAVLAGGWLAWSYNRPLNAQNPVETVVDIPPGTSMRAIANLLVVHGVTGSALPLELTTRLTGVAGRTSPGEYQFSSAMSPHQMVRKMIKGDVVLHAVTLPEGIGVREIIQRFTEAGLGTPEEYAAALLDADLARTFGVVTVGVKVPFEGYLFPATYRFPLRTPPRVIFQTMLRRMDAAFTPEREARRTAMGWTRHQVLTLASLIEKETGAPQERPRIGAVFHNRLRRGMRLQTDPTVIYAIPNYDGDIRFKDLRREDPYNTYLHKGLPPGPIASPGEAAIDAALFPADDPSSLYFVSRGNGTHIFSKSLEEHNRSVDRYQRGRRSSAGNSTGNSAGSTSGRASRR